MKCIIMHAVLSCFTKFFFPSIFVSHSLPCCEYILEMDGNEQFDKRKITNQMAFAVAECESFFYIELWCLHRSSNALLCIQRTIKLIELVHICLFLYICKGDVRVFMYWALTVESFCITHFPLISKIIRTRKTHFYFY